ncbi:MAG: hypothetical protein PW789_00635 [Edaphobacter sp.]|uniref:hypothetical protein n=1 Tax=Edaphobacter sp. TaxID=1934404 RepID=UPI00238C4213|nr:hypothetical protein [Edaphobacter sp.]MDE1175096.1 hypothetical protein [Edaphobacter sp.]
MSSSPVSSQLQRHALRQFTVLMQLRPSWAGRLVLSLGLGEEGAAFSMACHIAGAVSLAIDDDPDRLRVVVRSGAADFVVNTLDEAIRAIKNEVRKGAPLSVALKADMGKALEEILARGMAPSLFTSFGGALPGHLTERACDYFVSLGAAVVDFDMGGDISLQRCGTTLSSHRLLAPLVSGEQWKMAHATCGAAAELRRFDEESLRLLPEEDRLRRRWLEGAPSLFQSIRPPQRWLWVTKEESAALDQFNLSFE